MDQLGWGVIGIALAATIWLIVYVGTYLPARLDERFRDSLRAFCTAIELRFPGHKGVSKRTLELCRLTGYKMGLPRDTIRNLMTAALVKDIGLCAIPYRMLNEKSPAEWDEAEKETFSKYPEVSVSMLANSPSLRKLAPVVRQHQLDFRPGGDQTEDNAEPTRVEARILRVASDYAWLEKQYGQERAREAIVHGIGAQYDPTVVRAFLPMLTSARDV